MRVLGLNEISSSLFFESLTNDICIFIEINLEGWFKERDELVKRSTSDHFSNDVVLTKKDQDA